MPNTKSAINAAHPEPQKLYGLDHLRAIAILAVLCFHYQFFGRPEWEAGRISKFGWSGVDLFFVLSGFLIAGQLFATVARGKPISLREFFIKRFFRIIPPYLLVLVLYLVFPVMREWGRPWPAWKYFTFTLNFGQDLSHYGSFSHAWSLCVEEQFYLLLPLTFLLFGLKKAGKKPFYLVGGLVLFGILVRYLSWKYFAEPYLNTDKFGTKWNEFVYYPTYNRLDGLLVGVSIAGLFTFYPRFKDWVNKYSYVILFVGAALLFAAWKICIVYASYDTSTYGFPIIALGYGCVLAAFVSPSCIFYRLKSRLTAEIATLSYAIYLSHKIVIHLVQKYAETIGLDKNSILVMMLCVICVASVALLMRYVIEKPALQMRNCVLTKWKKPSAVVTSDYERKLAE
jgi:peptidoglycan/LPS O-acetylase OafA/YrhL